MTGITGKGYDAAEPIAVVGMAMRFPGGSHSSEQLWDMLVNGRSAHSKVPKERFNADGYYHPNGARAGSININGSYFLSDSALLYDAPFFSMTANEANGTDPQQRLMLEVAYEALENAGIPVADVVGSKTGVYVGCFTKDFEATGGRDPYGGPFYAATGNGQSMLSNRVSWFFDFRGPSMTIDTACSSSLYAVHLACQSLKLGETRMALIGGTNLICDPSYMRDMCTMTFFSPDGVCHSFDHRANGYARGDGIGGIILKTLKQALADGDTIRGVIRSSGLNQDGKTPGITMPSPHMQAELIRSTYAAAGLSLDQTYYFEAHGTGTAIGDPYELSALGATFGQTRGPEDPVYAGSVKTNIGHLEGCAGLAGLMKAVLVVENGQIPPLAGFEKANPRLKLEEWRVALPEKLTPWPVEGLRRASVNSFGYGGANAHVIVDDVYHFLAERRLMGNHKTIVHGIGYESDSGFSSAPTPGSEELEPRGPQQKLFVFSSADQAGLQRISTAYTEFLEKKLDTQKQLDITSSADWSVFMDDLAYTLGSRRSKLDHRTFVVAQSVSDLSKQLASSVPKLRRNAKNNNVIFVFTGQGAQWPAMGQSLTTYKVYRDSLDRAQASLDSLGCYWSLVKELFSTKETSRIDHPEFSQPLCTCLQLALVDLLRSWGVTPKSVVGHSSGEIGAAYAAGLITHENAVKVAYLRGIYSADVNRRQPHQRGAMMAVGLSEEKVRTYFSQLAPNSVVVACVNAPNSVTLSGDEEGIDYLEKSCKDASVFARKLRVQTAYHSPHMRIISDDYLKSMGSLEPPNEPTNVTMFSSVTGAPVSAQELDAAYWVANMLNTVQFNAAVRALITQPASSKGRRKTTVAYSAIIECGPAEALKGPLTQILTSVDDRLISSVPYGSMLVRGSDATQTALQTAGRLWAQGIEVDLMQVNFQTQLTAHFKVLAELPPYPWNHTKKYVHESAWSKNYRYREKPRTDLLGMRLQNQDPTEPRWHNYIRLSEQPWISDHKAQQIVLYPGAAMIVMALEAARELIGSETKFKAIEARNVVFKRSMLIPAGDSHVESAIHLRPQIGDEASYKFKVFSQAEGEGWQEICSGSVAIIYGETSRDCSNWSSEQELYAKIRKRATRKIAPETFYRLFDKKMNLQYGPLHQNVTECIAGTGEGHGTVTIPDTRAVMPSQFEYPHLIHPATLDAVFHMQALGYLHSLSGDESLIPVSIESIYVAANVDTAPGSLLRGYSKGLQSDSGSSIGDIVLSNDEWSAPKVVVRGFLSKDISATAPASTAPDTRSRKCTNLQWQLLDQDKADIASAEKEKEKNIHAASVIAAREVIILSSVHPSEKAETLAKKITAQLDGCVRKPRTITLPELWQGGPPDFSGQIIISLLEIEEPTVAAWTIEGFDQFKSIAQQADGLLWITRGGQSITAKDLDFSVSTGLLRTVRVEKPQLKLPHLDLSPDSNIASSAVADIVMRVLSTTILSDAEAVEQEFAETNGKLLVPRLLTQESFHAELGRANNPVAAMPQPWKSLNQPLKALLSHDGKSLPWCEDNIPDTALGTFDVEIRPIAVSFDSTSPTAEGGVGRDAVGTVSRVGSAVTKFATGELVVACASDTMKTFVRSHQNLVRHVPKSLNATQAVALPTALCAAEAALVDAARLQHGESILICGLTGTVEQAMIILAKRLGAHVFATAESAAHKELLVERLGLEEDHILDSTQQRSADARFKFDIVVSTVPGTTADTASGCLADFGRFVAVGSHQMAPITSAVAYNTTSASIDVRRTSRSAVARVAGIFDRAWEWAPELLAGMVGPTTFTISQAGRALEHIRNGDIVGDVVLTLQDDDTVEVLPSKPAQLKLDPEATYVLSGGFGGIGRSIADLMFSAGARNISFLSRSGARTQEAQQLLDSLRERGCKAEAYCCDISEPAQVEAFVEGCIERRQRIKGVVQCAMVLRDSMFDNMTFEQWTQSTRPKIQGSWNLHQFMPTDMDFFIMLSSMAGVIGNPGQANYSAAGTYQDALSQHRRANGLASMTIDLGIVSDVGYIAENTEQFQRLEYLKNLFISERELHAIVSAAMLGQTRDRVLVPVQLVTGVGEELLQDGSIGSAMAADLKYSDMHRSSGSNNGGGDSSEDETIKEELRTADSVRSACKIVEGVLAGQLARALTMEKEDIDMEKPMHAYGVDSLAAIEIRNMVFRKLKADLSVFDILSEMPLVKMAVKIVTKSKLVREDIALSAREDCPE